MGSWPQGKGYSLSFLQLAFTVSLAELMHHIFEAQVPCEAGSDCRQDLTDSLYLLQPALLGVIGKILQRIHFKPSIIRQLTVCVNYKNQRKEVQIIKCACV